MKKLDKAVEFKCDRCQKIKKSKIIIDYKGQKLCNACYGELLSKEKVFNNFK